MSKKKKIKKNIHVILCDFFFFWCEIARLNLKKNTYKI